MSDADLSDLMHLLVTHFFRTNVALHFDRWWLDWIDRRQKPLEVLPPEDRNSSSYVRAWPMPCGTTGKRRTPHIRLTGQTLNRDLDARIELDSLTDVVRDDCTAFAQPLHNQDTNFRLRPNHPH